jgi:hypothetical protein
MTKTRKMTKLKEMITRKGMTKTKKGVAKLKETIMKKGSTKTRKKVAIQGEDNQKGDNQDQEKGASLMK